MEDAVSALEARVRAAEVATQRAARRSRTHAGRSATPSPPRPAGRGGSGRPLRPVGRTDTWWSGWSVGARLVASSSNWNWCGRSHSSGSAARPTRGLLGDAWPTTTLPSTRRCAG